MSQIHGMLLWPCATNDEEYEKIWKGSDFFTDKNFMEEYRKHIVAMQHTAACAKMYITKNWEEVKSWKGLDVIIRDNSGAKTEYFNYVPREKKNLTGKYRSKTMEDVFSRIDERDKAKHNPIETLTRVVLDPTDGDFSLTINGRDHLWIDDESVIIIADFIEKHLKNEQDGKGEI